jgi:hypothetical protein
MARNATAEPNCLTASLCARVMTNPNAYSCARFPSAASARNGFYTESTGQLDDG